MRKNQSRVSTCHLSARGERLSPGMNLLADQGPSGSTNCRKEDGKATRIPGEAHVAFLSPVSSALRKEQTTADRHTLTDHFAAGKPAVVVVHDHRRDQSLARTSWVGESSPQRTNQSVSWDSMAREGSGSRAERTRDVNGISAKTTRKMSSGEHAHLAKRRTFPTPVRSETRHQSVS